MFSSDGKCTVWRKSGTSLDIKNCVPTIKHGGGSIMVWGCFSYNGVGKLHFIDGTMDRFQYKRILVENLEASREMLDLMDDFTFQQDNDPKHKSQYVQDFFEENAIKLLEWPSKLPDLNPIEHLWDYLKREVKKQTPRSRSDLRAKIESMWYAIPKEYYQKLIDSMPKGIEAVVRAKGGCTGY